VTLRHAIFLLLFSCPPALAHKDDGALSSSAYWTYDPWLIIPLYVAALLFFVGTQVLWRRAGGGQGIRYWQVACFWAGWLVLSLSLVSPLHWLAERMLTAHMIEHELIMAVSAPLLVMSRPTAAYLWAFGRSVRRWFGRVAHARTVRFLFAGLTLPLVATVLHSTTILVWHIPIFFDAALANPLLHKIQHATFLLTALLFWWVLLGLPRRLFAIGALHLFITMLAFTVVGALLALSPSPMYRAYESPLFFTRIEDQQLAGVLMWIPGCGIYAAAAVAMFWLWLRHLEARPATVSCVGSSRTFTLRA
jgi:cytochrome c oxidase assembly factor CtaG